MRYAEPPQENLLPDSEVITLKLYTLWLHLYSGAPASGSGSAPQKINPSLARLVDDASSVREDRRQGCVPWPLSHLPDSRGRVTEGYIPRDSAADRRTATKIGPSVGLYSRMLITTGGVCLDDKKKGQIGLSGMVRAATKVRSRAEAALWLPDIPAEC